MLNPVTAVLASVAFSLAGHAQSANRLDHAVTNNSPKAFRTVDSHKNNLVCIDPHVDWCR